MNSYWRVAAFGPLLFLHGCGTVAMRYPTGDLLNDKRVTPHLKRVREVITNSIVPGDWEHCYAYYGANYAVIIRTSYRGHKAIEEYWPELICVPPPSDINGDITRHCQEKIRKELLEQIPQYWVPACSSQKD